MDTITSLSVARMIIGVSSWAAPALSLRLAMLDDGAPQSAYLLRLFGVRDIALGAATLSASGAARTDLVKIGIVVDAADAVAGLLAASSGGVSKPKGALLAVPGLAAVAIGWLALAESKD
ncbi:MAG TPA: hypothetical protein VFD59_07555 [Nocardioidaceae bacterium]|nr:hypothetical protein [Nocardioidaceae bacterium]